MLRHPKRHPLCALATIAIWTLWLGSARDVDAGPCPTSAVIEGEPALVRALFATDALSTVSNAALPGCPTVWVTVTERPTGLLVHITDHLGRQYERNVGDLDTAAALIESWARGDTLMSALPPLKEMSTPPSPPEHTDTHAKPASRPPPPPEDSGATPAPCPQEPVEPVASKGDHTVGAGFEFTLGADKSAWFGGRAYFCTAIGITCIGSVVRGAADPTISGKYRSLTTIRSTMEVLMMVSLPFIMDRLRIVPLVGLGAGWVQTSKRIAVDDDVEFKETSFGGVRLELSAIFSLNIVRGLYLELALGLTTSFIAEEETVTIDGQDIAGEPRNYLRVIAGLAYRWS